jgi:hypothetical protein
MNERAVLVLLFAIGACATAGAQTPSDAAANGFVDGPPDAYGDASVDASMVRDAPPGADALRATVDAAIDGATADAFVGSCTAPGSGTLATWAFAAETGDQASTVAASTATGVVAGAVARGSGVTPDSGAGSINSTDWALGGLRDPTKYYTFAVSPPPGCLLDLTTVSISTRASTSGPASAVVATSIDGFKATTAVGASSASAVTLAVANAAGLVELRIYGYAAMRTTGTWRLDAMLSVAGVVHE